MNNYSYRGLGIIVGSAASVIAEFFCTLFSVLDRLLVRTFLDDLPPRLTADASLDLDRLAHESHAVEPAERSRFLSYLDRARSHDLFAGDGFAYG